MEELKAYAWFYTNLRWSSAIGSTSRRVLQLEAEKVFCVVLRNVDEWNLMVQFFDFLVSLFFVLCLIGA